MKLRTTHVIGLATLALLGGNLGVVRAETLKEALSSTYRYNPTIDAERARLRGADEDIAIAMSGYRPIVTASADIAKTYTKTVTSLGRDSSMTHPKSFGFTLVQQVFNGFQTTNAVRQSEALVRAARELLRATEHQVLLNAVTSYMDVIRDQAIVKLRENNVNVLARELKAVQDRFAVGEVTRTDLAQSQARRAFAVSSLDLARATLKISRATYERIIGHPPSNLVEPSPNAPGLPKSLDEALSLATQENPNNIAALYREQAARHAVDRIRGELLPQVNVQASYDRSFNRVEGLDDRDEGATVIGNVSVPIYEGGEVRARIRQAKEVHVAFLQDIEDFRMQTNEQVTSAWAQMLAARAQRESDQIQVEANRTALAGVREEEKVGQRTLLDVLNAEQELLNAEVAVVTTRRNLVVLSYSVVASIGRLDAVSTGVASEVYDPEVHYKDVRREWWSTSITHGERGAGDGWSTSVAREPSK